MTLTQKEYSLLSDLKSQEQLCVEKYARYESEAKDPTLKNLFNSIKTTEGNHLGTVQRMLGGEEVTMPMTPMAASEMLVFTPSTASETDKKKDAFLCADALSMEKHVSSVYDTAIFEFQSPVMRDTLAHIQKEEQIHGEKLYEYMAQNGMYSG